MRLIDANALLNTIEDATWYSIFNGRMVVGARSEDGAWYKAVDIIAALNNAPTIDAVPVVRCKDCKWSGSNRVGNLCNCAISMHLVELNDYCSRGKRRADNGADQAEPTEKGKNND